MKTRIAAREKNLALVEIIKKDPATSLE